MIKENCPLLIAIYCLTGVCTGLGLASLDWESTDVTCLLCGFLSSLILLLASALGQRGRVRSCRRRGIPLGYREQVKTSQRPYEDVFESGVQALQLFNRLSLKEYNRTEGRIRFTTRVTWESWGEIVSVAVRKREAARWHRCARCECQFCGRTGSGLGKESAECREDRRLSARGKVRGVPVMGTAAHSWVMSFACEMGAFRNIQEKVLGDQAVRWSTPTTPCKAHAESRRSAARSGASASIRAISPTSPARCVRSSTKRDSAKPKSWSRAT